MLVQGCMSMQYQMGSLSGTNPVLTPLVETQNFNVSMFLQSPRHRTQKHREDSTVQHSIYMQPVNIQSSIESKSNNLETMFSSKVRTQRFLFSPRRQKRNAPYAERRYAFSYRCDQCERTFRIG